MVIQIGRLLIYNVYLLPETTHWAGSLEKDPCEALAASLALAYAAQFDLVLFGDLNARIAALRANAADPPRTSMDKGNPTARESGKFTSFQGRRKTVIDYVACSRCIFEDIQSFSVADQEPGFDHAVLTLKLKQNIDMANVMFSSPRKKRKGEVVLPNETELLIATLAAGKDKARKLLDLYGPVHVVTTPVKVTIHGFCLNAGKISASAGAATYWGTQGAPQ
ncbi:hypothetical protein B0H10DRAFT_1957259 [Mycena sp. CBHHK59/15]|nr:hypothetical protein B0H10DRAFT_1957259 [Mycena sp. CBHHK59/15]